MWKCRMKKPSHTERPERSCETAESFVIVQRGARRLPGHFRLAVFFGSFFERKSKKTCGMKPAERTPLWRASAGGGFGSRSAQAPQSFADGVVSSFAHPLRAVEPMFLRRGRPQQGRLTQNSDSCGVLRDLPIGRFDPAACGSGSCGCRCTPARRRRRLGPTGSAVRALPRAARRPWCGCG